MNVIRRVGFGTGTVSMSVPLILGEISTAEHEAGRGMLSVVVVHKSGDGMPGAGFLELARSLGRDTGDRVEFWASELDRVYRTWADAGKG